MNTNKQGKPLKYENSFKIAVVREYLTSNLGYGLLAKKYNLSGPDVVRNFVRWYKKKYAENIQEENKANAMAPGDVTIKQALKQLKQANLKIAGLEMLLETAQKELGIDIIKKPGTKQL